MCNGRIFNIQKYSIHDGPGIRTTVFLKGCPLSCIWCHNPESQAFGPEIMLYNKRCIGCGKCVEVCKHGALFLLDGSLHFNRDTCTSCGSCTEICYAKAREAAGKWAAVQEVMYQIDKDSIFYDESGGGVTFSGGEPLSQPEFLLELLTQCKKREYHTAVDTSGYGAPETIKTISGLTDLFLYDLKLMDDDKHMKYTGVSNKLILENLKTISQLGNKIFIRIPLIPGINDDESNIKATAEVIQSTPGIEQVNILPYHNIAADKYNRLGKQNSLMDIPVPSSEYVESIAGKFLAYGIKVKIGG
ncbi:MAG TPA: glycyl-radical enzyme activating protein [Clostridia bacterium]|nr:glycyl-radical enzyme activating protein [Clostridia bacterium]